MPTSTLATLDSSSQSLHGVFVWSAVLVAAVLVAFGGYSYLRRWMRQADPSEPRGFTLSELRQMHRDGKLSDEEFEATKAQLVGAAKRAADALPPVLPRAAKRPGTDDPVPDNAPAE